jgi:hypothetical protein
VNRAELVASMNRASTELLREKGFINFVDVLIHMGKLTREDHESWRMKRIPHLERARRRTATRGATVAQPARRRAAVGIRSFRFALRGFAERRRRLLIRIGSL